MDNFDNFFIFYILLLISLYGLSASLIYEVKSFSSLRKSLRFLDDDNSFLHEVKGNTHQLNYYYTTLYLGKDKSPQFYILDTGSSITTSPCSKCTSCGKHLNEKYKLENESQIIPCQNAKCNYLSNSRCLMNQCSFYVSYAEGSKLSGIYVNEDVFFETIDSENNITNSSYNIPIGCTTTETHLFKTQLADGIMGLNNNDKSFVNILHKLNAIKKNIFSLCFSHQGGYFSIGGVSTEHHLSKNISYIKILNKNIGNYLFQLNYIKIGDKKIEFNEKAFVDSGTTISYFPNHKFNEIMKGFLELCKKNKKCGNLNRIKGLGYCTEIDNEAEIESIVSEGWSNITFVFEGHEFIWEPENYHFIYNNDNRLILCLGFDGDNRSNILLGTTFMHGYDIIFDKEVYRIGFVPADCNRVRKIEEEENNNDENSIVDDISKEKENKINVENINDNEEDTNKENKKIKEDTILLDKDKKIATDNINNQDNNKNISDIPNNNINQSDKIIDIKIEKEKEKEKNKINEIKKDNINSFDNITFPKINEINVKNVNKNNNINDTQEKKTDHENIDEAVNERTNYEKIIINFSMFSCIIIFIVFILFNIILFRENYIIIQKRKNDNNLNQYELEIPKESNANIMSLFNESI